MPDVNFTVDGQKLTAPAGTLLIRIQPFGESVLTNAAR